MCDNLTTVTKFIHQTLLEKDFNNNDVNFETIISNLIR